MTAQLIHDLPWNEYAALGFLGSSALSDWPEMSHEAWSAKYLEKAYEGGGTPAMVAGSALDVLANPRRSRGSGRANEGRKGVEGGEHRARHPDRGREGGN